MSPLCRFVSEQRTFQCADSPPSPSPLSPSRSPPAAPTTIRRPRSRHRWPRRRRRPCRRHRPPPQPRPRRRLRARPMMPLPHPRSGRPNRPSDRRSAVTRARSRRRTRCCRRCARVPTSSVSLGPPVSTHPVLDPVRARLDLRDPTVVGRAVPAQRQRLDRPRRRLGHPVCAVRCDRRAGTNPRGLCRLSSMECASDSERWKRSWV